jgi:F-type H+-transporting ATPase subunit epsilon
MKLKIVTPEKLVLETDTDAVFVNTPDGEIGILTGHVHLVTPLQPGVLRYQQDASKHAVAVMGGLLRTDGQTVTVLATVAETAGTIDLKRAEQAKDRAEKALQDKSALSQEQALRMEAALMRSLTRLKTARDYSTPLS